MTFMPPSAFVEHLGDRASMEPQDCIDWPKGKDREGYGRVSFGRVTRRAPRVVYELFVGPIPEGMTIDHLCNNPPCVNPFHLTIATAAENSLRGNGPTAVNARKSQCSRGHEFTPENTYVKYRNGRPYRGCRICRRAYEARMRRQRGIKERARNTGDLPGAPPHLLAAGELADTAPPSAPVIYTGFSGATP